MAENEAESPQDTLEERLVDGMLKMRGEINILTLLTGALAASITTKEQKAALAGMLARLKDVHGRNSIPEVAVGIEAAVNNLSVFLAVPDKD